MRACMLCCKVATLGMHVACLQVCMIADQSYHSRIAVEFAILAQGYRVHAEAHSKLMPKSLAKHRLCYKKCVHAHHGRGLSLSCIWAVFA